jgi:pyruvate/2-oxoglutarate dehydrogenase complex dihydrolipoamide acyltransferase (E2) component
MKKPVDYTLQSFPSSRKLTMDGGKIGMLKHHVKALIEVDVTESRKKIASRKAESGQKISFSSWILKCIAQAISEHKEVHAIRRGSNQAIIFNDIDISILVEKKVNGTLVPLPLVIRKVNSRNLTDIYNEIEKAKKQTIEEGKNYVIEQNREKEPIKLFTLLPQFIRLFLWKIILRNPHRMKRMMGTVVVTSVGMIGRVYGWAIPYSFFPVCFSLGSIMKKPGVVNDSIEIREYLGITILIDHDVIDGAPAARFVSRLSEIIENGFDL